MHTTNPRCPKCGAQSYVKDKKRANQLYSCKACKRYFTPNRAMPSNPPCPSCDGQTRKRGMRCGNQQYSCAVCKKYYTVKTPPAVFSDAEIAGRQSRARLLGDSLPKVINDSVPKSLPTDIRDDITQEIAVAALCGEFDLSELPQVVPRFRRKVYSQLLTGFRYVSLDAPIPHTDGLTYAKTLAG